MENKILIDQTLLQQTLDMLTIGKKYAKILMLNQELFNKVELALREALEAPQPAQPAEPSRLGGFIGFTEKRVGIMS